MGVRGVLMRRDWIFMLSVTSHIRHTSRLCTLRLDLSGECQDALVQCDVLRCPRPPLRCLSSISTVLDDFLASF
jgi:hypothetical protein